MGWTQKMSICTYTYCVAKNVILIFAWILANTYITCVDRRNSFKTCRFPTRLSLMRSSLAWLHLELTFGNNISAMMHFHLKETAWLDDSHETGQSCTLWDFFYKVNEVYFLGQCPRDVWMIFWFVPVKKQCTGFHGNCSDSIMFLCFFVSHFWTCEHKCWTRTCIRQFF